MDLSQITHDFLPEPQTFSPPKTVPQVARSSGSNRTPSGSRLDGSNIKWNQRESILGETYGDRYLNNVDLSQDQDEVAPNAKKIQRHFDKNGRLRGGSLNGLKRVGKAISMGLLKFIGLLLLLLFVCLIAALLL